MRRFAILFVSLATALAVAPATAAATITGSHDGPDGVQSQYTCAAWGWAVDNATPSTPVTVRILVDGSEIARVLADDYRDDLVHAGVSASGKAAFTVDLRHLVVFDAWHDIRAEAFEAQTSSWIALDGTPRRIACHTYTKFDYDLFALNPANGGVRQLTSSRGRAEWNADWSPDGTRLVHDVAIADPSRVGGVRVFLGVTTVATGKTRAISGTSGGNDGSWSPDGTKIAFDRLTAADRSVYVIAPNGGTRRLVRHNAVSADYSPSGKRIVFLEPSTSRIMSVDTRGGSPVVVARLRTRVSASVGYYDINPEWSPDGRWITYSDGGQIWKVRVTSSGAPLARPVRMTSGTPTATGPTWSPDSATVIYQALYEGDSRIWSIGKAGGIPAKLTTGSGLAGFGDFNGALSPSGDLLVFSSVAPVVPS